MLFGLVEAVGNAWIPKHGQCLESRCTLSDTIDKHLDIVDLDCKKEKMDESRKTAITGNPTRPWKPPIIKLVNEIILEQISMC